MLSYEESVGRSSLDKRQDLWHSGFGQRLVVCWEACGSTREEQSGNGLSNVLANTSPVVLFASRKNAEGRNDGSSHKTRTFRGCNQRLRRWSGQKERFPTHEKAVYVQGMAKPWIFPPTFDHGVYDARRIFCFSDNRQEYVDSQPQWTLGHTRPLYIERWWEDPR